MPNDKIPPLHIPELPDSPELGCLSRLRRVVDVSALNTRPRSKKSSDAPPPPSSVKPKQAKKKSNRPPQQRAGEVLPATEPASLDRQASKARTNHKKKSRVHETSSMAEPNAQTPRLCAQHDSVCVQSSASAKPSAAVPSARPCFPKVPPSAAVPKTRRAKLKLAESKARIQVDRQNTLRNPKKSPLQAKLPASALSGRIAPAQSASRIVESLLLQSWRARQWVECITRLGPTVATKLEKCLPLAQAKLVFDLSFSKGQVDAKVVDQSVSIQLRQFTFGQWRAVITMLSDRAIFTTSLLNGELPEGVVEIFKQGSVSLFPQRLKDFTYQCDCHAVAQPCEHACALLLAIADALDEDPFNLLLLRGITRDEILSQLRDARSDQVVDEKTRYRINYEMPAQNVDFSEFYQARGDFGDLNFHISFSFNTLLRRLGDPAAWQCDDSLEACIAPLMNLAGLDAEQLGLCDANMATFQESGTDPPDDAERIPVSRAPKFNQHRPQFDMPDLSFILTTLPESIFDTIPGDPVATAEDIIRWLKTRGAADIRTLARRTRLNKVTIQAFLQAFCIENLVRQEGDDEKARFIVTF